MNEIWLNLIEQELETWREQARLESLLRQRSTDTSQKLQGTHKPHSRPPRAGTKASPDA